MTQVRKQPLPVGRYWISVISAGNSELDHFREWTAANPTRIKVLASEPLDDPNSNGAWFLFLVLKPTKFDQKQFGFPTEAGPEIQHRADTVQRPKVPTPLDTFQEAIDALGQKLRDAGIMQALLIGGLVYAFTQLNRK